MTWLRSLIARWRQPITFPYPSAVTAVRVGAPTEICEAEWRAKVDCARIESYQAGLAEGEIRGRLMLAGEIEAAFGPNGVEITLADARLIRQRQLH